MAWAKNGTPSTLTGTADVITISDLTAKTNLVVLWHRLNSGASAGKITFNSDTGYNYARRHSYNGGGDSTSTIGTGVNIYANDTTPNFVICYIINISTQEKLFMNFCVEQNTAGAGTAPNRVENIGKWANNSSQITRIDVTNTEAGDFAIGSNLSAIGTTGDEVLYKIQNGTVFEETDTNRSYIFNATTSTWVQI